MLLKIKKIIEKSPYAIGSILAKVPFRFRLGRDYTKFHKLINTPNFDNYKFTINHFSEIFEYAKYNIPFYYDLYKKNNILNLTINSIDDIKKIPIITKEQIRDYSGNFSGAISLNTGGTSGEPFSFFIDKNAFAREWAHMHHIWRIKKYKYTDLKLSLRGNDLGNDNIRFNSVHNEFIINTYKPVPEFINEIINLFKKREIKFLHGYPSAIYNFLIELDSCTNEYEKKIIKRNLKACFLGSEFPMPHITDYIKLNWNLDYISWYGHSEMCILAYDKGKDNNYFPLHTYGYTETLNDRLIGTSFHNFDMPLIRYDTGDLVKSTYETNGLLKSFKVSKGRNGEFIIDKKNKQISLTSLIFGRHHEVFNYAKFIQIKQKKIGEATIYITTNQKDTLRIKRDLDLQNIEIDFTIEILHKPIRTRSGKISLKI